MKKETTRKSSKTLRAQLFSAIAMMMIAAISLGASTYAWFITQAAAEIQTMQFTATTASSMQVAVRDKTNTIKTDFKNTIVGEDIIGANTGKAGGWTSMFANPLVPATTTFATGATGMSKFFESTGEMDTTGKLLTTFKEVVGSTSTKEDEPLPTAIGAMGGVKKIPLTFLSSAPMKVYFTAKDDKALLKEFVVAATAGEAVNGVNLANQAKAIANVLHFAIVDGTTQATIFQTDAGLSGSIVNEGNNTDYGAATGTVTADETKGIYKGIKTVATPTTGGKPSEIAEQKAVVLPTTITTDDAFPYTAHLTVPGATTYKAANTTPKELFSLLANTPKNIDVYIWFEGTDAQCLSALSKYQFGFNLNFAGVVVTP